MGRKDNSRQMILFLDLCRIKNLMKLFNLELHELFNLFSRKKLYDSVFQDSIIVSLKCSKLLIKKKFGLDEHTDPPDKSIPSTFEEETYLLDSETMLILKRPNVTHYRQLRKELLNHLDDSMTHDFL
jgi:hypothetical protein